MTHKCPKNISIIKHGKIYKGCGICLSSNTKMSSEFSAKGSREWAKKEYRKDLLQPNQPKDFVRAYGADTAREYGYSESQIRKYS